MQGRRSQNPVIQPGLPLNTHLTRERIRNQEQLGPRREEPVEAIPLPQPFLNQEEMENQPGGGVNQQPQLPAAANQPVRAMEMRNFARPMIEMPGSSIVQGQAARSYELKSTILNQLPTFYGLPSEDPIAFIRNLTSTVEQMPLNDLNEHQLLLRCFPHCLKDRAKSWLTSLPAGSIRSWTDCFTQFMDKYYGHTKTNDKRQELATFVQYDNEPFNEAHERFKQIEADCPHHRYEAEMIVSFFYNGLTTANQCIVDSAAGGTVGSRTAREMMDLFEMLSSNSQQRSSRKQLARRTLQKEERIDTLADSMEHMQKDLRKLLQQGAGGSSSNQNDMRILKRQQCNACGLQGHTVDQCQGLKEENDCYEQAHWMNNQYNNQRRGGFGASYNPSWKHHQNFSWSNPDNVQNPQHMQNQQPQGNYQRSYQNNDQQQHNSQRTMQQTDDPLQEIIRKMDTMHHEIARDRESNLNALRRLEMQVGQIAADKKEQREGMLPSQSSHEHVKVMHSLRSGKQYASAHYKEDEVAQKEPEEGVESSLQNLGAAIPAEGSINNNMVQKDKVPTLQEESPAISKVPFPTALNKNKSTGRGNKAAQTRYDDLYAMMSKVEINVPLLELVTNVPAYAKFFKEVCSRKKKL